MPNSQQFFSPIYPQQFENNSNMNSWNSPGQRNAEHGPYPPGFTSGYYGQFDYQQGAPFWNGHEFGQWPPSPANKPNQMTNQMAPAQLSPFGHHYMANTHAAAAAAAHAATAAAWHYPQTGLVDPYSYTQGVDNALAEDVEQLSLEADSSQKSTADQQDDSRQPGHQPGHQQPGHQQPGHQQQKTWASVASKSGSGSQAAAQSCGAETEQSGSAQAEEHRSKAEERRSKAEEHRPKAEERRSSDEQNGDSGSGAAEKTGASSGDQQESSGLAKLRSQVNPKVFDLNPKGARFFVIKSFSEDDVHRSIKYTDWCSTDMGNNKLEQAYREREGKGPIYLFFSVNRSGHFCGMAQMMSRVDFNTTKNHWALNNKWKGSFKVKWIYVKDVPNQQMRHIRLENNENKPVTNSRDCQEVPVEKGKQVLKIIHSYPHQTSIFDDYDHYENEERRKKAAFDYDH